VIPLCVALAACGSSDDSDSGATRPEAVTQHTASPSPDAGSPTGPAPADRVRHRGRAERPPRFWAHCARIAR
jgi:hypothetical protein